MKFCPQPMPNQSKLDIIKSFSLFVENVQKYKLKEIKYHFVYVSKCKFF